MQIWMALGATIWLILALSSQGATTTIAPLFRGDDSAHSLIFEQNTGQADGSVRYLARGRETTLFFRDASVVIATAADRANLVMHLAGSAPHTVVTGVHRVDTKINYFRGSDSRDWLPNVAAYSRLHYEAVYLGIDLDFYGNEGALEYDFTVAPGSDPQKIAWSIEGHSGLTVDAAGGLAIASGGRGASHRKPIAYQVVNGTRRTVDVRYVIRGRDEVGFEVGSYDRRRVLVIDPVVAYSSYFGGAGDDEAHAVAVRTTTTTDADGHAITEDHVYITGSTSSPTIPNTTLVPAVAGHASDGSAQATVRGMRDVFVSEIVLRSDGQKYIAYTTYLGCRPGTGLCIAQNSGNAIAVASNGEVVVAGVADEGFVTTAGSYGQIGGGLNWFAARLSADGTTLLFSAVMGGSASDQCNGVAIASDGGVILVGEAGARADGQFDFPGARDSSGALRSTLSGAPRKVSEAVIAKLAADGKSLLYSNYLGGSLRDAANGVAIAADDTLYIVGGTSSTDIPAAPDLVQSGPGFVMKIDAAGTLQRFGYFSPGQLTAIALDVNGNVHVVSDRGEVARLGPDLKTVAKLSLGLSFRGRAIAADANGNSWVAATTNFRKGLVRGAEQMEAGSPASSPTSTVSDTNDGYIAKIGISTAGTDPTLTLRYASYLGGTADDEIRGVAVDAHGSAYLVGVTSSADFPRTQNALQHTNGGGKDAFVRRTSGDIDEDGIPDTWETVGEGIDLDRNGVVELDLAALGATPTRKDVFLEIDYLVQAQAEGQGNGHISPHTHRPNVRSNDPTGNTPLALPAEEMPLRRISHAFDTAPVAKPADCSDCRDGISLHFRGTNADGTDEGIPEDAVNRVIRRNDTPPLVGLPPAVMKFGTGPCDGYFLRPSDRADPATCMALRQAWFQVAHYVIWGHGIGASNVLGFAEPIGNDIIVAFPLGESVNPVEERLERSSHDPLYGSNVDRVWSDYEAYLLMHELGHNLGLDHGGGRGIEDVAARKINCKPNYLSVMNYTFAHPTKSWPATGEWLRYGRRELDYSRRALLTLNERALDESQGLGGPSVWDGPSRWDTVFSGPMQFNFRFYQAPADAAQIDWSTGLQAYDAPTVSADLNNFDGWFGEHCRPSPNEVLVGHDDWSNLVYDFRVEGLQYYTSTLEGDDRDYPPEPTVDDIYLSDPTAPRFTELRLATTSCNFVAPTSAAFESTIGDLDNDVVKVEYFVDNVILGTATSPPYHLPWHILQPGQYLYSAKVTDAYGWSYQTKPAPLTVTPGVAPTVGITAPEADASFTAGTTIPLSARVSDSDGCVGPVEFYAGNVRLGEGQRFEISSGVYLVQFNWTNVPVGTHTLTARTDQGALITSLPVTVTVLPNVPPVIQVVTPSQDEEFRVPATIEIGVEASDSDSYVTKVEFYADGVKIGETDTPAYQYHYSFTWSGAAIGTYVFTARATDLSGATTVSAPVPIAVVTNMKPKVQITAPVSPAQFRAPVVVTVTSEMFDVDGSVTSSELFVNGVGRGAWPGPLSMTLWRVETPGTYSLRMSATDNEGAVALSDPVEVVITQQCAPPTFEGLASVVPTGSGFHLEWPAAEPTCDDRPVVYNVYRSEDPEFVPSAETSWYCPLGDTMMDDIYELEPGHTYYYIVRALHGSFSSCFRTGEDANLKRLSAQVPPLTVAGLELASNAVVGGATVEGTVTLSAPATAEGAVVVLATSSSAVSVPSSVTVPPGALTATFVLATVAVAEITPVEVTATYGTAASAALSVLPPHLTEMELIPPSVVAGESSTVRITLDGPAPASGLTVSLTSSNTAVATVANSLIVGSGSVQGNASISTNPAAMGTNVVIGALLGGAQRSATLSIQTAPVPPIVITSVVLSPGVAVPGVDTVAGTVTLASPSPAAVDVTLQSSPAGLVIVPAFVHFAQGATAASFSVVPLKGVATSTTLTVSATSANTAVGTLRLDPPIADSIEVPASVASGASIPLIVRVRGMAVEGGLLLVSSSDPAVVSPTTVIQDGAVYSGAVQTGIVYVPTPVTLSVTSGGVTVSSTVTIRACTPEPSSLTPPAADTVWIEDEFPEWAIFAQSEEGESIWDFAQHVSGTASIKFGLATGGRRVGVGFVHETFPGTPSAPDLEMDQTLVSYVLINPCEVAPTTLAIEFVLPQATAPSQTVILYWGDGSVFAGESGAVLIRIGDVPAAGQWRRLEVPLAATLHGAVSTMAFRVFDGELWWDHIGVTPGPAPARLSSTTTVASTQHVATAVTWTATALGGAPPPQYRFERLDGTVWTTVQAYSSTSTYTWTPGSGDAGVHSLRVSVRNQGSVADWEDRRTISFNVVP